MSNSTAKIDPLPDLIDESLDEATFLWQRWEAELASPHRNLDEIWDWTEDRLAGALDGVRVAPDSTLELLLAGAMASDDSFRQTAAASALATAPARNSPPACAASKWQTSTAVSRRSARCYRPAGRSTAPHCAG